MNKVFKGLLAAAASAGMILSGVFAAVPAVFADNGEGIVDVPKQQDISIAACKVSLSQTAFNYTGSAVKPDNYGGKDLVTVKDDDKKLVKGVDYDISYTNNTAPGAAVMTVTGKGKYSESVNKTFIIRPEKNEITKLTSGNGGIRVEWKKDTKALAYQILYSQDSSFSTYHSTTVKDTSKTYVNLTNVPKAGETWYVKVRSFVTKDGNVSSTRYGYYSPVKKITTYSQVNKVTIPYISYTYSGKEIKPTVKVWDVKGNRIPEGSYTAVYSNNVKVGTAKITVTCSGAYAGTYVKEFYVKPAKNEITSLTVYKNGFKVNWKQATPGAVGYQVLYSTTSDFSSNVHSYTSKNLYDYTENFTKVPKTGETWYVKVRSFITKDGTLNTTRYGNYSAVKSISTVLVTKTVSKDARIYSTAAFSPTAIGYVTAGTAVDVLEQSGCWYKIKVGYVTGWVYNKAFGVTSNVSGKLTTANVGVRADDILFDIGTTPKAIMNFSINKIFYRAYSNPNATRDELCVAALTNYNGACYHHAAMCDLLLERAGYRHIIIKGRSTSGEHNWNAYYTADGWRYMDSTSFVVYPQGFVDFTSDQVRNIRSFTWDASQYEAD